MTARELMTALIGAENMNTDTVDTCKWGDPDRELRKVGTCLTPTPDVLRAAGEWGADLLITHEPCVYDHLDQPRKDPVTEKKLELLRACGYTIWRLHDYIHNRKGPDGIHAGFIEKLGLKGTYDEHRVFIPETPLTAFELAKKAEAAGWTKHARIAGDPYAPAHKILLFLGACGAMLDPFVADDAEIAVVGETSEWRNVEQMRDALQFGMKKAYLVLGHGVSEAPGMEWLAEQIEKDWPSLEVRYFPVGDIYTYTD